MIKRQSAAIAALLVFFFSVFPAKRSDAFVPSAGLGIMFATPVGQVALVAVGIIGLSAMYLTIKDAQDNAIRIPLGPNEFNQPPQLDVGPDNPLQIPGTVTSGYTIVAIKGEPISPIGCHASPSGACSAIGGEYIVGVGCWLLNEGGQGGGSSPGIVSCSNNTCPKGYVNNGSVCSLDNPRQVQDDKTCDILFKNGQFSTAGDMNCASSADGSSLQPLIRDGNIIAYGTNSDGQPIMWTVTPGVQGATVESYWYVRQSEQIQTDIGTMVKTTTVAISPDTSTITSVSSSTSPGSISFPSGSGSPGVAPSIPTVTDPVTNPTSPENTPTVNTPPGLDTIVFPNDYARTGEASKAADKIVDKLDSFSNPAEPTQSDPEIPDDSNFDNSFFKNVFDPLLGWKLPSHESICPVANFALFNQNYVMDAHCLIAENNRAALSSIMMVAWVLAALFIVLKA